MRNMSNKELGNSDVTHIALIVKDIEKTAKAYAELFGLNVPQWTLYGSEEDDIHFRGQPTNGKAKIAFIPLNNIRIELIEPVGGPSIWQEFLETEGEGIQHISFRIKGMDKYVEILKEKDMLPIQTSDYKGGTCIYFSSKSKLGTVLELTERTDS